MRRLLLNAATLAASNLLSRVLLFVGLALVARRIPVESFGVLSVSIALGTAAFVASEWGLDLRALQAYARRPHRISGVLGDVVAVRLFTAAVAFGAFLLLGTLVEGSGTALFALVIGAYVISALAKSLRMPFIAVGESSTEALLATLERTVGFALIVLCLSVIDEKPWLFGASLLCAAVLAVMLSVRAATTRWRPNRSASLRRCRVLLASATPMGVNALAVWVYYRASLLLLAEIEGQQAAGVLGAVSLVTMAFGVAGQGFILSIAPRIASVDRLRNEDVEATATLVRYVGQSALLCAAVLSISAPFLVKLLFGEGYLAGVDVLRILSLHVFFLLTTPLLATALRFHGSPADVARFAVAGALLSLASGVALISWIGAVGAAVATLVGETLVFVLCVRRFARLVGVRDFPNRLRLSAAAPVSAALCVMGLVSATWQLVCAGILAGLILSSWRVGDVRRALAYLSMNRSQ